MTIEQAETGARRRADMARWLADEAEIQAWEIVEYAVKMRAQARNAVLEAERLEQGAVDTEKAGGK